jgi:hypothetical protein
MSDFSFTDPTTGRTIKISGPANLTEAQARSIFEKQLAAGALVALKPGNFISSATQAAAGLPGASSSVLQSLNSAGSIGQSVAQKILSSVKNFSVTDGIGVADFASTLPSAAGLEKLTSGQVTGLLSQSQKLVDQLPNVTTDQGLGSYALSPEQLEAEGYLRPGTVSTYLSNGQNSAANVLKSPAVWTGKDGINDLNSLLSNDSLQQKIQENLMQQGLGELKQLGIPVDQLSSSLQGGLSLLASKNVAGAADWVKNKINGQTTDINSDNLVRDGVFAADFVSDKLNNALRREDIPPGFLNTVDRSTLDAATERILGDKRIPPLIYSSPAVDPAIESTLNELDTEVKNIEKKVTNLIAEGITSQNAEIRLAQLPNLLGIVRGIEKSIPELSFQLATTSFNPQLLYKIIRIETTLIRLASELEENIVLAQQIQTLYQDS